MWWVFLCVWMGISATSFTATRERAQPWLGGSAGLERSRNRALVRRKGVIHDFAERETLRLRFASDS